MQTDITSIKETGASISHVNAPGLSHDDEAHFIDSLSIYKDFKSKKFVKELYERER